MMYFICVVVVIVVVAPRAVRVRNQPPVPVRDETTRRVAATLATALDATPRRARTAVDARSDARVHVDRIDRVRARARRHRVVSRASSRAASPRAHDDDARGSRGICASRGAEEVRSREARSELGRRVLRPAALRDARRRRFHQDKIVSNRCPYLVNANKVTISRGCVVLCLTTGVHKPVQRQVMLCKQACCCLSDLPDA